MAPSMRGKWLPVAVLLLGGLGPVCPASDELPKPADVVRPTGYVSLSGVHPGGAARIAVVAEILDGWHVNAHVPSEEFLIPTEVAYSVPDGLALDQPVYPEGKMVTFEFAGRALRVYESTFAVAVSVRALESAEPGPRILSGTLTYQPCNDRICLPPAKVPFELEVVVAAPGEAVRPLHPEVFEKLGGVAPGVSPGPSEEGSRSMEGASPLVFGLIFLGGLALNLTPCVFPLIPITIAFFGGQVKHSVAGTFGLSALYVLGMSTTYSLMGVAAALTGSLFGAVLQNPWVLAFIALVLVALSLSMFGVYELRLPGTSRLGSRAGPSGALFMGLVVGLVAAPCIGPFVLGLLTTVAREANPVLGFWKFFVLSLGLGAPYLFLAVFSGAIAHLPRSGEWMDGVKRIFGLALLAMAAYFAGLAIPGRTGRALLPAAMGAAALWLLVFDKAASRWFAVLRSSLAVGALAFSVWLLWPAPATAIRFAPYSPAALADAAREAKPVIIEFTAEWCIPCREYEHKVFADPRVASAATSFAALRADLTRYGSPEVRTLVERWRIFGPPTIVFVGAEGSERADLRLTGFVPPDVFLQRMQAAAAPRSQAAGPNPSTPEPAF